MLGCVALAAALLAPAGSRATSPSGFRVGAAVGDMTPPAFDPAHHTPSIDPPGFTGARQWDFQEPYIDQNGNGYWDPGEPYVDENHNGRYDSIWPGGGGGRDNRPAQKVADPITARAFVVDNGAKRVAVEVLDTIGTFEDDLDLIRADVRAQLSKLGAPPLDEMFISSTHDESAPDVIGLWGPGLTPAGSGIGNSGVNDYWMAYAIHAAADAIVSAATHLEDATMRFAETTQPSNFLTCWSSYPYVRASKIPILQAVSNADGHVIVTMMNYGIHAETLGFNGGTQKDSDGSTLDDEKYWLSADWPYWARKTLEDRYGGVAIQMAGAVGSVETPKVFPDGTVSAAPTGQNDPGHPAGCRTVFSTTGTPAPLGYFQETRAVGEGVAQAVIDALDTSAETSSSTSISFERRSFFVPLDNGLFIAAGLGQVFPRRPLYVAGVEIPELSQLLSDPVGAITSERVPAPNVGAVEVRTEMVEYRIGDAQFISAPGELFPFTYVRGSQGPGDMPYPSDPMSAFVTPLMTGKYRFIEGLGEDMIGYLFPRANSTGVPGDRPIRDIKSQFNDDSDRFGCGHSDDSEAASGSAGNVVSQVAVEMLTAAGTSHDQVLRGRWVWPDGTWHRSPIGDGTLGCRGKFRLFSPAPGAPVAVVVKTASGGLRSIAIPGDAVAFVDYNGVAQGLTPTVDTRGVLLADGTRLYLDVYPGF
jgi:hypothetical protein